MTSTPAPPTTSLPTGKVLISAAALFTAAGAFAADWNETHIYNPTWPPHAKFHNAQTMNLAVLASGLSLWQLWGPGRADRPRLRRAVLSASLFWLTQAPAAFYPGAALTDPEDPWRAPSVAGVPLNQVTGIAAVLAPLLAVGYALEVRRLRRSA